MKTSSKILNKEFDFQTKNIGLFVDDNLWVHDKWIVIINGQDFEYKTGIGYREALNIHVKQKFQDTKNRNPKQEKSNLLLYIDELNKVSKPKPLNIDDVLYSLILDSQYAFNSFDDFCQELGYDEDSRKAFEVYQTMQKNAKKVKTFISNLDEATELFQDF